MLKFEFDTSEIKKFRDSLEKAIEKDVVEQSMIKVLQDMGKELLSGTKRRTPVDTGDLKRNWEISDVKKVGDDLEITMFNPTKYAMYVEYGHRTKDHRKWIEGAYMGTLSMKKLQRESDKYMKAALDHIMKEVLGG